MAVKQAAKYLVNFMPGLEILGMEIDRSLDVIVRYRHNGKISKSTVRLDRDGQHYFCAAKQKVYYSDLRRVAYG